MSNVSGTVTRGHTWVVDGSGNLQVTTDRLNSAALPVVLMTLDSSVASEDLTAAMSNLIPKVTLSVGAEASDAISVTLQVENTKSSAITEFFLLRAWLSDTQYGSETATSPSTSFAASTGTELEVVTAKEHLLVITDTDGVVVLKVDHTGGATHTWYLNVELDGRIYTSEAIIITI